MDRKIETLQDSIDHLITRALGEGASGQSRRKARIFLGVAGIIAANVWLGPVIGHGIAAILGTGIFFVVGLAGRDTCKGEK